MDKQAALELLARGNARQRLDAARALLYLADPGDAQILRAALRDEAVPWVRSALGSALETLDLPVRPSAPPEFGAEDDVIDDVYMRAMKDISLRLIHELRPLLGKALLFAEQEFGEFDKSKTRLELERLGDALAAIEQLGRAATPPVLSEVNLRAVAQNAVDSCVGGRATLVDIAGPDDAVVASDRGLLEMIMRNAISNALDAVELHDAATGGAGRVTVTWGKTDRDYWMSVLDDGAGVSGSSNQLFETGVTTKAGHFGMGLATARTAAISLRGTATLGSGQSGGALFQLRIPLT